MEFPQKTIEYKVLKAIKKHNLVKKGDKVVVAVSGGADSVCSFFVFYDLRERLGVNLSICHYNHNTREGESDRDEEFVRDLANKLKIQFFHEKSKMCLKSEEEAREARYRFFEKTLEESGGDRLVTAHTADDVAETFLFRLIRGTGLLGLTSIPPSRGKIIRPLLTVTRGEIIDYLNYKQIDCVVDRTNFETSFRRNYLRLKVFPLLKEINPSIIKTLSNTASMLERDASFIRDEAKRSFNKILISMDPNRIVISREEWIVLPSSLKYAVIRLTIERLSSLVNISMKQINEIYEIIEKGEGKKFKDIPHSLRVSLVSGKIILSRLNNTKETNEKSK